MRIVLATGNAGKLDELRALLADLPLALLAQSELDVPPAEESAVTFVENALIKARHAARLGGLPAIADDSGLEVDQLNGEPGVRSARYAGEDSDDADNNRLLLERMAGLEGAQRRARFRCVAVYLAHPGDPSPIIAQGKWEGRIAARPRGKGGFGYDPVFEDPELGRTAAELDPAHKNRISHRARALSFLAQALRRRLSA